MTTRTGTMKERILKPEDQRFNDPPRDIYCSPLDVTHIRVFSTGWEDGPWMIDGSNHDGSCHTDAGWTFDTFDQAISAVREFVEIVCPHLLEGDQP